MNTKLSFWLIPDAAAQSYFQEIINVLAQEYDAPIFTPHVTIYSGEYEPDESVASIIEQATFNIQNLSLQIDKLAYTNEFTKSLFVQFFSSPLLSKISTTIGSNSRKISSFSLNPHLSLIYQYLSEEIKQELVRKISLPNPEIVFNEIKVIATSPKVQTKEDVENWQEILSKKL